MPREQGMEDSEIQASVNSSVTRLLHDFVKGL